MKEGGLKLLKSNENKYKDTLTSLFQELKEYWDEELSKKSTTTSEDTLSQIRLPHYSQTRLCLFLIANQLYSYYRKFIFPIAEKFFFSPIATIDVITPGENIIAKITALIDRATLIVADISSQTVITELSWIKEMSEENQPKKVLIIYERDIEQKILLKSGEYYISQRPVFPEPPNDTFLNEVENFFKKSLKQLEFKLRDEPTRLLEKKEYKAAIISAMSSLEGYLRKKLIEKANLNAEEITKYSLHKILNLSQRYQIINGKDFNEFDKWRNIRNRLAHNIEEEKVNKKEVMFIVRKIINFKDSYK